jgi:hypothetical protein
MANTRGKIKERRLERMRMGQATCSYADLVSDPEVKVALVPLTEAEYEQCLEIVANLAAQDNIAGFALRDRRQAQEILVRSIREESDLTERIYDSISEMMEDLEVSDIDQLIDEYNEMTEMANPRIDGIPEEELEELKKALQEVEWSELSDRSWYPAKRFLGTIMPLLHRDNLLGSTSTKSSTTTSE